MKGEPGGGVMLLLLMMMMLLLMFVNMAMMVIGLILDQWSYQVSFHKKYCGRRTASLKV